MKVRETQQASSRKAIRKNKHSLLEEPKHESKQQLVTPYLLKLNKLDSF